MGYLGLTVVLVEGVGGGDRAVDPEYKKGG